MKTLNQLTNLLHPKTSPLVDREIHALSNLFPYESFDPDTNLYFNRRSAGFILECAPLTGSNEEMVTILTSLLTDTLPDHADLQCLLWCSNKIGGALDAFERARSSHNDIVEWLAKKRTDFLKKGTQESLSTHGNFIMRDFRLFLVVSVPCKQHEEVVEELLQLREDFVSSLKSIYVANRSLLVDDFLSVLREWVQPSQSVYSDNTPWQPQESLALQITNPEYRLKVQPHHLLFEHEEEPWEVRSFSVRHRPIVQCRITNTLPFFNQFSSALTRSESSQHEYTDEIPRQ
jgi:conjugal transfer ATP-binding protein TraC